MIAPCLVPVRAEKLHDQSIAIAQRILPSASRNQREASPNVQQQAARALRGSCLRRCAL